MPSAPLRVIFAGTPEFAVPSLHALAADPRFTVVEVWAQPDRPTGRGQHLTPPPVKVAATELGLPIYQQPRCTPAVAAHAAALAPDFLVTAAYGLLLPDALLAVPRVAPVNVHASLLPRWRGASPIAAAILAGDCETGLSFFRMERALDAGPVFRVVRHPLTGHETAGDLTASLAALAAAELPQTLAGIATGELAATPQPTAGITFCGKIAKSAGQIDWQRDTAEQLARQLRAYTPWPGLTTFYRSQPLKITAAEVDPTDAANFIPGSVLAASGGVLVATAAGFLRLLAVQAAGRKQLPITEFLRGEPGLIGSQLG